MEKLKRTCLSRETGKAEILALLLYIIGTVLVSCFHEPWFDEAQAWLIARSASLYEILFEIPHYEGHPQMWHLLLVPFAKAGLPFHPAISAVNLTCCTAAMAILLFRSPFPKIVRCLIPFSYFCFYQYAVICRPYSVMMLAVMLMCLTYSGRNQHPWRFILSLTLFALCSAYTMVIAGCLCILWCIDIFQEYRKGRKWGNVLRDSRVHALTFILLIALFVLYSIIPAEDCLYSGSTATIKERFMRIPYFFALPLDSLFGSCMSYDEYMKGIGATLVELLLGGIVWVLLGWILKANRRMAYLFPLIVFVICFILIQPSVHHIGICTMYLIFVFWDICKEKGMPALPTSFHKLWSLVPTVSIRRLAGVIGAVIALLPMIYSAVSSVLDIRTQYSHAAVADYLKEHGLDERKIMVSWLWRSEKDVSDGNFFYLDNKIPLEHAPVSLFETNMVGVGTGLLPYFEENIFMNYNTDDPDTLYMRWQATEDYEAVCKLWHDQGLPEVIIGYLPLDEIFSEEELEGITYHWVESFTHGMIFKLSGQDNLLKIYVREDVLEEYPELEIQTY